MGRLIHQYQSLRARLDTDAFFKRRRFNQIDGKSLRLRFADRLVAAQADRIFARGQSIFTLREARIQSQRHFAEQTAQKWRPQLRIVVKEAVAGGREAAGFGIERDDLSLPLGIEDIPVGFESTWDR
jgi:hypothetical protein